MIYFLTALCTVFFILICILSLKIFSLRKAADEIRRQFKAHASGDTNTGIKISSGDSKMRKLASDIDSQLKSIRMNRLKYEHGDRTLKEAVTSISHDLRTPLTAISGYLDLLKGEEASEKAKEYISIISERTQTMKNLIQELLDFSVILSGSRYIEKESVSLNSAFEECLAAYYGLLTQRGITPKIIMPQNEIVRYLNESSLSRILGNIISNAAKYSDCDFVAELRPNGEMIFSNSSSELDAIDLGRLFDRFFTVQNGRSSTGLGLSIARTLTENMGGSLTADYSDGVITLKLSFPEALS